MKEDFKVMPPERPKPVLVVYTNRQNTGKCRWIGEIGIYPNEAPSTREVIATKTILLSVGLNRAICTLDFTK